MLTSLLPIFDDVKREKNINFKIPPWVSVQIPGYLPNYFFSNMEKSLELKFWAFTYKTYVYYCNWSFA